MEQLIKIIKGEIKWCKKNKKLANNDEFIRGFIEGLEQAIFIIKKVK